jgi:hypothetical protein
VAPFAAPAHDRSTALCGGREVTRVPTASASLCCGAWVRLWHTASNSLRCEGSDAIGAKRTCRERRKRVDLDENDPSPT